MKLFPLFLISFFLMSCAFLQPQQKHPVLPDQQAFGLAFTEFQESHRISGFKNLMAAFPHSIWAGRAETIILYAQELDRQKAQNKKLRGSEQQYSVDLEQLTEQNRHLADEAEHLKQLNQQLTDKIEQLKSLLIQSEKYPQ